MKKIIVILVALLGFYSIFQIGNAFSSDVPDITKEEKVDKVDNLTKDDEVQKMKKIMMNKCSKFKKVTLKHLWMDIKMIKK